MFDLVAGNVTHVPRKPIMPIIASSIVETITVAGVVIGSLLFASGALPQVSPMAAFVAELPFTAPPPPPPPLNRPAATPPVAKALAAAPIEAPRTIEPEAITTAEEAPSVGVDGGVVTGMVGSLPALVEPPPPPPPAPPARPAIRRIGGDLRVPALLRRVEPVYPPLAQASHLAGVVLLDAVVGADGKVEDITVLKGHPLLVAAAIDAVKQWQYAPLMLNGDPIPFALTVTLRFSLS
jgi:periplasmic protein TonB